VLLDEVEDGIDPHILPRFIGMIARESKVQLIVTSHSPVLVNASIRRRSPLSRVGRMVAP
jgi:predicted ATPase